MKLDTIRWTAAAGVLLGASYATAQAPAGNKGREAVLAQAGDLKVTAAQLDQKLAEESYAGTLFSLRTQEYQMREAAVFELLSQALLEKEAKAQGITADQLTKKEVDGKVSDADVNAFYESVKARVANRPEADVKAQIRQDKVRQRRSEFLAELRTKAGTRVFLDPPRAKVDSADDPAKGPKDAPVTIVEFSDFQCPFCSRVTPTINKVLETYKEKVRVVFRDFPLPMHPQAMKAAEAASCANEQGKFWQMHDKMFENQQKLQVAELKQYAAALGLNSQSFDQCLDSGKYAAEWKKDTEDGGKYGVQGTPAFFVNGRFVNGAQPYETFSRLIDDELARVKPVKTTGEGAKASEK